MPARPMVGTPRRRPTVFVQLRKSAGARTFGGDVPKGYHPDRARATAVCGRRPTAGRQLDRQNFDNVKKGRITGTKSRHPGNSFSAVRNGAGRRTINFTRATMPAAPTGRNNTTRRRLVQLGQSGRGSPLRSKKHVPAATTQTRPANPGYVGRLTSGVNSDRQQLRQTLRRAGSPAPRLPTSTGNSFSADDTALGGVTIKLDRATMPAAMVGNNHDGGRRSYSFGPNLAARQRTSCRKDGPDRLHPDRRQQRLCGRRHKRRQPTGNNFETPEGRTTGTKFTESPATASRQTIRLWEASVPSRSTSTQGQQCQRSQR